MLDIDEQVRRIYKNPYEEQCRAARECKICGGIIEEDEDYYRILGIDSCERCVARCRVLG